MQHPGNRVVRQLPRLAGPGQFPQRGVQTELEALSDTQHHRATADAMVPCNGLVTLARKRIQQQRGPYGAPFLLGSGLADRIELAQFRFSELQGIALPREGHTPLKHNRREMYWYLENGHLVCRRQATFRACRWVRERLPAQASQAAPRGDAGYRERSRGGGATLPFPPEAAIPPQAGEGVSPARASVAPHATASIDRKSTRLNSSHLGISYAVFCLQKKNNKPAVPGHRATHPGTTRASTRHCPV